jgi:hypothetical protein
MPHACAPILASQSIEQDNSVVRGKRIEMVSIYERDAEQYS